MSLSSKDSAMAMSEINVTPLVDVMLVLLIIFIVTAPLLMQSVEVKLPHTAPTQDLKPDPHLILSIDRAEKVYLDQQQIPLETLETALRVRHGQDPKRVLVLKVDEAAHYKLLAQVIAHINRSGFTKVAFASLEDTGTPP